MFRSLRDIAHELEEIEHIEQKRLEQDIRRNDILEKIEKDLAGQTGTKHTLRIDLGTPVPQ